MINMAQRQKVQMPQSTAGLIRYFESEEEAVKFKPEHVIIVCILIIALEMLIRFML